jgi:hypothetical protein
MCDKIVALYKDDIRMLIKDSILNGTNTATEIAYRVKKKNCLDNKCDFKATGYILSVLKTMMEEKAILSDGKTVSINEDYAFLEPIDLEIVELKNKVNISGHTASRLSRTDRFLPAWDALYVGQKIEVLLVPEPNNPNDENAIAAICNGKQIGYLQREVAKDYKEKITDLVTKGYSVVVNAEVIISKNMGIKNCIFGI